MGRISKIVHPISVRPFQGSRTGRDNQEGKASADAEDSMGFTGNKGNLTEGRFSPPQAPDDEQHQQQQASGEEILEDG